MKNATNLQAYERCLRKVISFICSHLEEELSVDRLSGVAGFSKFIFIASSRSMRE